MNKVQGPECSFHHLSSILVFIKIGIDSNLHHPLLFLNDSNSHHPAIVPTRPGLEDKQRLSKEHEEQREMARKEALVNP